MSRERTDRDTFGRFRAVAARQAVELPRRNVSAIGMDGLYLLTIGFFTVLATKAWVPTAVPVIGVEVPFSWPLLVALLPLGGLLYFGWRSSKAFFLTQLAAIALTVVATQAGLIPF